MSTLPAPAGPPRGEEHCNAKLTEARVQQIRALHRDGWGYGRIAELMGVSRATIERIVKRRSWAHVA